MEESGIKARLEDIRRKEEKAQKEFQEIVKFLGGSTKGVIFYMKASDLRECAM